MRTALDDALKERDAALRKYKRLKRAERDALFTDGLYGLRFRAFSGGLRSYTHPEHADQMLLYVEYECKRWLADAPENIRYAALELCGEREQQIRTRAGLDPIDDPLPGEPDNFFRLCKKAMRL